MNLEITLRVNGVARRLFIDTRTTLLDALRERLGLTGLRPRAVRCLYDLARWSARE